MPWRFASASERPTCATWGSVYRHEGIRRSPVDRLPPLRLSRMMRKSSMDDFRIIRDNLKGGNRSTGDRLMPSCLYTDPQVAHVGLSEADAKRQGIPFHVARLPMASVLRTRTISETN